MRRFATYGLLLAALTCVWLGCAQPRPSKVTYRWPWQHAPEKLPGIQTPQERIDDMAELADHAARKSPEERERIAAELAAQIQHEPDKLVRLQIVRTLAAFPTAKSSAVLHAGLEDPDTEVRVACCDAWGDRGGEEAVQELSVVLQSESEVDVRLAAARGLAKTKNAGAVKPLAGMLVDSDPAVQRRAIESLRAVSGEDYGYNVEAWQQYAAGQPVKAQPVGIAERLRKMF